MRICLRSLKTTPVVALEVEADSIPLPLRREFLAQREVIKVFERNLSLKKRFYEIKNNIDDHGLTFLEKNYLKIVSTIDQSRNAKVNRFPPNLRISELVRSH